VPKRATAYVELAGARSTEPMLLTPGGGGGLVMPKVDLPAAAEYFRSSLRLTLLDGVGAITTGWSGHPLTPDFPLSNQFPPKAPGPAILEDLAQAELKRGFQLEAKQRLRGLIPLISWPQAGTAHREQLRAAVSTRLSPEFFRRLRFGGAA